MALSPCLSYALVKIEGKKMEKISDSEIVEKFLTFGSVENFTRKYPHCGYVVFNSKETAQKALSSPRPIVVKNCRLKLTPQQKVPP